MDYFFIAYILLSFVIGVGGTYQIIKLQRPVAATLYLIGAIAVLIFFGLRWFSNDRFKLGLAQTDKWPPIVNLCPDFLTIYERNVNGAIEKVCVDLIGVAPAGGIQKLTAPEQASGQNSEKYVFKLYNDLSGSKRTQKLCEECKNKKVSWEGIYDGTTCVTGLAPNADGTEDECPAPSE